MKRLRTRRLELATLTAVAVLFPAGAWAGRTAHLFAEESQIVPEGYVELEQWVWGEGRVPANPSQPVTYWLWWGPVIGLTPHWELSMPIQVAATPESAVLDSVEADARYRIFPREQDDGFQPLVHLAYQHTLAEYEGPPRLILDLVATYGAPSSMRMTVNLGTSTSLPFITGSSGSPAVNATGALGFSVPVKTELRFAAEVYGVVPLAGKPPGTQLYAGPSVAWTHGPFWLTLGSLFGLTSASSRFLPKVLWAVSL
jgi:hypothetical protein